MRQLTHILSFSILFWTVAPCLASAQSVLDSQHPSVIIGAIVAADEKEEPTIRKAAADLNQVLVSPEFHTAVANMHVSQMELEGKPLNGEQVYESLVAGSPHAVEVEMVSYRGLSFLLRNYIWGTEGLEDPRYPDTCFVNRTKFNGQEDQEGWLASLMLHEASHMIGFEHDTKKSALTDSVPYALNGIYAAVAPVVLNKRVTNVDKVIPVDSKLIDKEKARNARVQ